MKKLIIKTVGVIIGVLAIVGISLFAIDKIRNGKQEGEGKIVSSNFVGYDFARAVVGDKAGISMLLKPGMDAHDFEPTPEDIIKIKEADLFIYIGGELEKWVSELLDNNDIPVEKTLKLMDMVSLKEEEIIEGMEDTHEHTGGKHQGGDEHEDDSDEDDGHEESEYRHEYGHDEEEVEYDEHIWTSPINAMKMVSSIGDKMSEVRPENKEKYQKNVEEYNNRLTKIDQEIREIVKNAKRKELLFADRFPFRYFVDEYGLDYYAVFPGCSEQTEASSKTVAFMINKIKENNFKVILKIELTSDKLAESIASETGAKILELNAVHNISQDDFEKGVTYADIMEKNLGVLREALE